MRRISIDVTFEEHKKLKAMAALRPKSIKDYVLERTLGGLGGTKPKRMLKITRSAPGRRHRSAQNGSVSRRTVGVLRDAVQN